MAIAAVRFKFLDKETNISTKDFSALTDNQVYNSASEAVDSALAGLKEGESVLDSLSSSMSELKDMIESGLSSVSDAVKSALNSAIDAIGKLELPTMVKDIFNSLKELDLGGVKDFVSDLLKVGGSFLCNNLDFLKMFMLGFALNGNVIGGLLTALLMSWLDRICKGISQEDQKSQTPIEKLETVIPPKGMEMNASNAFNNFTNSYTDYINSTSPINLSTPMSGSEFLMNVQSGNIDNSISNLRNSEISSSEKKGFLSQIDSALGTVAAGTNEFNNLLTAKGKLSSTPLISAQRRDNNIKYSNLSDQLGSMSKNLLKVDMAKLSKYSANDLEKNLYNKIHDFKSSASSNKDLQTRDLNSGSFSDFDFSSILPDLSPEEIAYLGEQEGTGTAHRVHDMHPTTTEFMRV